jgi:type IV secretory pathway protease TraF
MPAAPAGTAVTIRSKKHVTPKWIDIMLLAILIAIPVLYALGFSINKGPSMSYLGWVYKTSWGEQPTRVGQIVRFAPPDQPTWRKYILPSVKRVAEIRKDGYFVEGDNTERSQDSRDWGKVVPPDHVAGVVNWCWSPARAWRGRTAEGKLANWRELYWGPNAHWSPDGRYIMWVGETTVTILSRNGSTLFSKDYHKKMLGTGVSWRNNRAIWPAGEPGLFEVYDLKTGQAEYFHPRAVHLDEMGWIDERSVVMAGDATGLIKPGDVYKGRIVARVVYPFRSTLICPADAVAHTKVTLK